MTTEKVDTMERVRLNLSEQISELEKKLADLKEAEGILPLIPEQIRDATEWHSIKKGKDNQWELETGWLSPNEGDKLAMQLKTLGVQNMRTHLLSIINHWQWKGVFSANGVDFVVKIDGGNKPPLCTVKEEQVTWTQYKAVCEQTGQEID